MVSVDRGSGRPIYKQIADALREAIRGGELAGGQPLPSETELVRRYGVSRNSVRAAVGLLRVEGLVVTEHGRASFVRARRPLRRLGAPEHRSAGGAGQADWRPLGAQVVRPPQQVAARLRLAGGQLALVRRYLVWCDGEPALLADRYFPLPAGRPASVEQAELAVAGAGVETGRVIEELVVHMPSAEQARQLRTRGGPVVRMLRTRYDRAGGVVEVAELVLVGDRHVLVYEVPAT